MIHEPCAQAYLLGLPVFVARNPTLLGYPDVQGSVPTTYVVIDFPVKSSTYIICCC